MNVVFLRFGSSSRAPKYTSAQRIARMSSDSEASIPESCSEEEIARIPSKRRNPSIAARQFPSNRPSEPHCLEYHFFSPKEREFLQKELVQWYRNARRRLPWRGDNAPFCDAVEFPTDPTKEWSALPLEIRAYRIWISEIMLQQTRVDTVVDYYLKWIEKFPDLDALASADLEQVMKCWAGLGYYNRVKLLHKGAKLIHQGQAKLSGDTENLKTIPGIGPYTAGAIASIAFGSAAPLVDGNVIRVFCRIRGIAIAPNDVQGTKIIWKLAADTISEEHPGDFNQGLMELGATICTPKNPKCEACPLSSICLSRMESKSSKRPIPRENQILESQCTICKEDCIEDLVSMERYPLKKVKKAPRSQMALTIVVKRAGIDGKESEYLLIKRPKDKLKGSLLADQWEFPSLEMDGEDENRELILKSLRKEMSEYLSRLQISTDNDSKQKFVSLGSFVHIFSHIQRKVTVEKLEISHQDEIQGCEYQWVKFDSLISVGLTTSVQKVVKLIKIPHSRVKGNVKQTKKHKVDKKQKSIESFFS